MSCQALVNKTGDSRLYIIPRTPVQGRGITDAMDPCQWLGQFDQKVDPYMHFLERDKPAKALAKAAYIIGVYVKRGGAV